MFCFSNGVFLSNAKPYRYPTNDGIINNSSIVVQSKPILDYNFATEKRVIEYLM